jgi:hypothetical protein
MIGDAVSSYTDRCVELFYYDHDVNHSYFSSNVESNVKVFGASCTPGLCNTIVPKVVSIFTIILFPFFFSVELRGRQRTTTLTESVSSSFVTIRNAANYYKIDLFGCGLEHFAKTK